MVSELLIISNFASKDKVEYLREQSGQNPGYAIQKFTRLLVEGFQRNGKSVRVYSILAVSRKTVKKILWKPSKDVDGHIPFQYAPFVNLPYLRQFTLFVSSFFKVFTWGIKNKSNKVVVCDALCRSGCLGALAACRLTGVKCVGILTDMPGMVTKGVNVNKFVGKSIMNIQFGFLKRFDALVYMTKYVAEAINLSHIPSIVMEGSVDICLAEHQINHTKNETRDVVYAGCIHERHGLKLLVEAFTRLPFSDARLILFGDGSFCEKLPDYIEKDKRIEYRGVVPNDVILEAEEKATLLVNPRPSNQEFTFYSFPSKNHEYMVSGTPVLTTNLPCFPEDYLSYLFLFHEETVDGMYKDLYDTLSLDKIVLEEKGRSCRDFVLREKNNVVQSARILELIESVS